MTALRWERVVHSADLLSGGKDQVEYHASWISADDRPSVSWMAERRNSRVWDLFKWDEGGRLWRHYRVGTNLRELKAVAEGNTP